MKDKKEKKEIEITAEEGQTVESELYYNQYITINDNHGKIIFKQTGKPVNPPNPPPQ